MIEVRPVVGGFQWFMISADRRDLVIGTVHAGELEAALVAQDWRRGFWRRSSLIDGRETSAI